MSRRTNLVHEVVSVAARHDGSHQHKQNLRVIWDPFARFLQDLGISPRRIRDVPALAVKLYIQHCSARGMAIGSMHNQASGLRIVMKRAGMCIEQMTNAWLGVPRRDRNGRKVPLSAEQQAAAHERTRRIHEGAALVLEMQAGFGLRLREGLLSPPDLTLWYRSIANGAATIRVRRGCKGGRLRQVSVLEARRPQLLSVLARAIEYCACHDGQLVTGRGGDLRSSLNSIKAIYRQAGMTGEHSSHAMRYAYACASAQQRFDRGQTEHEVLAGVASDLGHGEKTRLRFTLLTYLRSLLDRFARVFRNGRLFAKPKDVHTDHQNISVPTGQSGTRGSSNHAHADVHPDAGFLPRRRAPRLKHAVWQTLRAAVAVCRPDRGEAQPGQTRADWSPLHAWTPKEPAQDFPAPDPLTEDAPHDAEGAAPESQTRFSG